MTRVSKFQRMNHDEMRERIEQFRRNVSPDAICGVVCVRCDDSGLVSVSDSKGARRSGQCPECRPLRVAGLPAELRDVRLHDVRQIGGNRLALERAAHFSTGSRDLFFSGPVGTGKTMLAAAIAAEFCREVRRAAVFVRWPITLHRMQPGNMKEEARAALERRLFTVPLLVLDDLGAERDEASDFTRRMAYLTYEERGDAGLRTIITSNLSLDGIAKHQGDDRLASRIAGRADVVVITGKDQRVFKNQARLREWSRGVGQGPVSGLSASPEREALPFVGSSPPAC